MKEQIKYRDYTVHIEQDDCPSNPLKEHDCNPPTLTLYCGHHENLTAYNDAPENIRGVVHLLPEEMFKRGQRVKTIKENLNCSMREFAEVAKNTGCHFDAFCQIAAEELGDKPTGWREAKAWFEWVEAILKQGGIQCLYEESRGYSQGDVSLVLVIATKEWKEEVGCDEEHIESNLRGTFDLYHAWSWSWGDVYGISSIESPDGAELDEGSVWGFYGSDHEKSGLLEEARSTIDWHIKQLEETALNEPACLI